jgi:uncharacterized protein (TIGR02300 family)
MAGQVLRGRNSEGFAFDSGQDAWQGSRRFPADDDEEVTALATPELGQKQVCPSCQAKFYDLSRRPAVCPKCQTAFDPEEALRNRRIRTRVPDYEAEEEKEVVAEEVEGFEEEAEETPEIDQAAEAEPEPGEEFEEGEGAAKPAGEDIGVEFAEEEDLESEGEEVPFLEDEDEDFADEDIEGLPEEGEEE